MVAWTPLDVRRKKEASTMIQILKDLGFIASSSFHTIFSGFIMDRDYNNICKFTVNVGKNKSRYSLVLKINNHTYSERYDWDILSALKRLFERSGLLESINKVIECK